jgi:hypothetical protein
LIDVITLYWPQSLPVEVMHLILEGVVPRKFEILAQGIFQHYRSYRAQNWFDFFELFPFSQDDILFLDRAVREFVEFYENLYSDPTPSLHVGDCIKNCSPAWGYWQFTMEKTCGNVVSGMQGKKHKDESVSGCRPER